MSVVNDPVMVKVQTGRLVVCCRNGYGRLSWLELIRSLLVNEREFNQLPKRKGLLSLRLLCWKS